MIAAEATIVKAAYNSGARPARAKRGQAPTAADYGGGVALRRWGRGYTHRRARSVASRRGTAGLVTSCVIRRGRELLHGQHRRIDDLRIVAKFDVERSGRRMRYGKRPAQEALGHRHRVGEFRISGDRVEKKQVGTDEFTCKLGRGRALELLQYRQPDEIRERLPLARHALGTHSKFQRAEGRGSEGPGGIERGDRDLSGLQRQSPVGEAQGGGRGLVSRRHLDALLACKRCGRLRTNRKYQGCVLRQFACIGKLDVAVVSGGGCLDTFS